MKKQYMKPAMQVVSLQHQSPLLVGSVKSLSSNSEGLIFNHDLEDEDVLR